MPTNYEFKEDGKLHTRYSELKGCTPGGVVRVVERRKFQLNETNPYTEFGTLRHEVFANFIRSNGHFPKAVGLDLKVDKNAVEQSYGVEVWENVVIHMTADLHNDNWVADFKTTTKGAVNYKNDKQVIFYAWMLGKLGKKITKGYYICELWDIDRTQIRGYEVLERDITEKDLEETESWAKLRVETLYKELTKENRDYGA